MHETKIGGEVCQFLIVVQIVTRLLEYLFRRFMGQPDGRMGGYSRLGIAGRLQFLKMKESTLREVQAGIYGLYTEDEKTLSHSTNS